MGNVRACLPALFLAILPAAAQAASPGLSDPVEAGDLELRPPRGFWPLEVDVEGSAALAPGGPGTSRVLLAMAERRIDAASFVVSEVDAPMPDGPDARDRMARQVIDHFSAMGMELRLRWTTPMQRPRGAVEVVGRMTVQGEERALVMAAGPLGRRQWMVTLSAPPQRLDDLLGGFEGAVASLRGDPLDAGEALPPDLVILACCAAVGAVVAAGSRLWRVRRARGG